MKIKGSCEGMSCDCILEKEGVLLKFKGFFGGDKGEELIKYNDIQNISLAKTAGLVSSPLLILESYSGIKKVVILGKQFKTFYELLENKINHKITADTTPEPVNELLNESIDNSLDKPANNSLEEPENESQDEPGKVSIHYKRIEEAKKLLDMGAITEEEFNSIKKKHLKKL
ncbi:MAG: hypothetical protein B655_2319 [Methanobacterium sp. Maddingley MBC34]|nr:MAG: hypothetical protein B655_2319 [Methanobacterium sp. Maddingley MBC34]